MQIQPGNKTVTQQRTQTKHCQHVHTNRPAWCKYVPVRFETSLKQCDRNNSMFQKRCDNAKFITYVKRQKN